MAKKRRLTIFQKALGWIVSRDTGLSSVAIWSNMTGVKPEDGWHYPSDPADLGRCLRLLKLIPTWRKRLPEMSRRDPCWRALVKHWDELEKLIANEVGIDWSKGRSAPRTYKRMKEILDPIERRQMKWPRKICQETPGCPTLSRRHENGTAIWKRSADGTMKW